MCVTQSFQRFVISFGNDWLELFPRQVKGGEHYPLSWLGSLDKDKYVTTIHAHPLDLAIGVLASIGKTLKHEDYGSTTWSAARSS